MTLPSPSGIPSRVAQPALQHDDFAASHDEEHSEALDTLAHDEPRTPGWLTAVGGTLFLVAILWFIAARASAPTVEAPVPPSPAQAQQ